MSITWQNVYSLHACLAILALLTCHFIALGTPSLGKISFSHRMRISSDAPILFRLSLTQCATECATRAGCGHINYNIVLQRCEIIIINDSTLRLSIERTRNYIYSDISTWDKEWKGECQNVNCSKVTTKCDTDKRTCTVSDCQRRPVLTNGYKQGTPGIGNTLRYGCYDGYQGIGGNHRRSTCNETGHWSEIDLKCDIPEGWGLKRKSEFDLSTPFLLETNSSTIAKCQKLCRRTPACMAFSNSKTNKTCLLSEYSLFDEKGFMSMISSKQSQIWSRHFNIFTLTNGTKNGIPFQDAEAVCGRRNTTVASRDDLDIAFESGYHMCSCSWVREKQSYMVLQNNCVGLVGGVWNCIATLANVFCLTTNETIKHSRENWYM